MTKLLSILPVALFLLLGGVVLAATPTVEIDPIPNQEFATFPQTINVTGTLTQTETGKINGISELKLFINDIQEGVSIDPEVDGNPTTYLFSLPWNLTAPGTYDVKVTAKHGNELGEDIQEDVVITQTQVIITECPAAPAIAGSYMKNVLLIKPTSKNFSRIIKLVAAETGSKGSLWAANACETGYADAVKAFVDTNR